MTSAAFFGLAGLTLTPHETAFFHRVKPAGYILFSRNIESAEQVTALTASLRALHDQTSALPILIDQEGGRVRRLRPPLVQDHPPARPLGQLYERDADAAREAAYLHGQAIGLELAQLGITVDCLPVLDLIFEQTHDVIGDRAFSADPQIVTDLSRSVMSGLGAAGIVPVIKHIPGHGRAAADSHLELPVVDAPIAALEHTDFAPFKALCNAPMAMTAHILYTALDAESCATHSATLVQDVIRKTIGFDGLLMTDDLSMKALGGTMQSRTEKAIAAGCDIILHCNGDFAEMAAVAEALPALSDQAQQRLNAAMAWPTQSQESVTVERAVAARDALLRAVV